MNREQERDLRRAAARRRKQLAIELTFLPVTALADGTVTPDRATYLRVSDFVTHLEELASAMYNPQYEVGRSTFGKLSGFLDRTRLIEGLGQIARLQLGVEVHYLILPMPIDVIVALEAERLKLLAELRRRLPTPAQFMAHFTLDAPRHWAPLGPQRIREELPALIALSNLLVKYCRHRYQVRPLPFDGWQLGREQETRSIACRFPPREHWSPYLRTWAEKLYVNHADFGGFVRPGGCATNATGKKNGTSKKRKPRAIRYDHSRLLFYMALERYIETRSLEGDNQNEYQVISFGERTIVDSPRIDNCLFGLEAPLDVCLRIAIRLKGEVRANPLCTLDEPHDIHQRWHDKVRTWLG